MVRPVGSTEKSRRSAVRTKEPTSPLKGRAITRPTLCSPLRMRRAVRQTCHSSMGGITASWAAIWNTLSAEVYTISLPVLRCSAPSSSMMAVPEAGLLPMVPMPVSASKASITSGGKPLG